MKKTLISLGVIAILIAGFFLLNQHIYNEKQADPAPATNTPATSTEAVGEPITVSGQIGCLPKVGDGPQTLECAIGLEAADGNFYSLEMPADVETNYGFLQSGTAVEIEGRLTSEEQYGPDGNRYDTVGTIIVEEVTEHEQ